MTSQFLITTAITETWNLKGSVLFAGDWCYKKNEITGSEWENYSTVPRRWADFSVLEKDYKYLSELHERLLHSMCYELNVIHQVNYSIRYWRILIGPWLDFFTTIFFDRWHTLKKAQEDFNISSTIIIDYLFEDTIPSSMNDFVRMMLSDEWNHYIFSICIKDIFKDINIKYIKTKSFSSSCNANSERINSSPSLREIIKNKTKKILFKISKFRVQNVKYFFISTYMDFLQESKLALTLFQLPRLYEEHEVPYAKISKGFRKQLKLTSFNPRSEFEKSLAKFIFLQLPDSYLENYDEIKLLVDSLPYPKSPSVFFTSNVLWYDTVMMAYAAQKIEHGCKLVYGQHGGYGIPKFQRDEEHERKISDRFLTWGWSDGSRNAWPVGVFKRSLKGLKRDSYPSRLLMVRGLSGRYTFRMYSGSGLNLNNAIDDCITFAKKLPINIKEENLLVRLYFQDYGFGEEELWRKECPGVEIAKKNISILRLLKKTRLAIYTYNGSTGWIEYMAAGIPVIMFWNMSCSPIRANIEPFFEKFKQVGIFHETPDEAAQFVAAIWPDVDSWWNSTEVKIARDSFLSNYANIDMDIVHEIKKNIRELLQQ